MTKHFKQFLILILTLYVAQAFSQEKEGDTLDTDVVNVVKPYKPTVSDAFKIKETPSLDDDVTTNKKEVEYNITSVPVASTFTPAKGKAAVVDQAEREELFDNYASLAVGTYTTILGELYLNQALSRTESIGGYINHHSSGGGIDGLLLDDDFLNSKININYNKSLRDLSWNIEAGYQIQAYNWYGLNQDFYDDTAASNINSKHTFHGIHLAGDIYFDNFVFDEGSLLFRRFTDDQGSGENRFLAKTDFDFEIGDHSLNARVKLDYLSGSFDRTFQDANTELKYGFFQLGFAPSYQIKKDDLTVNFGASFYYQNDLEYSENNLFIYPDIHATYKLVKDILIVYGGLGGDLIQNTYHGFAQQNPFISPTLFIAPTDQQYNGYVGLKGKLSNTMSYNLKGSYYAENNKALFVTNEAFANPLDDENYFYGNSFGVLYDDITTLSVLGELNVDINRDFTLGLKAEYFIYDTDEQPEAWNLPDITGSLFMDYQIDTHWFAGAGLYYVGERKDRFTYIDGLTTDVTQYTLDSYFDANAHVGYKINNQFSAFVKANNIANQNYQRFLNYPVQGIQFLAGATYKFDF